MVTINNREKLPMQLVMFEAKQLHDYPHEEFFAGAFINCYIKDQTPEAAFQISKSWIEECGWEIIEIEDQYEIDETSFEKPEDGLEYYQQALIDGEVYLFNIYEKET